MKVHLTRAVLLAAAIILMTLPACGGGVPATPPRVIAIAGGNALRNVGRRASAGAGNTYGNDDGGCAAGDDTGVNPGANPDRRRRRHARRRDNGGNTGHSGHLCAPAIPISAHGGAHARCAAASIADSGAGDSGAGDY